MIENKIYGTVRILTRWFLFKTNRNKQDNWHLVISIRCIKTMINIGLTNRTRLFKGLISSSNSIWIVEDPIILLRVKFRNRMCLGMIVLCSINMLRMVVGPAEIVESTILGSNSSYTKCVNHFRHFIRMRVQKKLHVNRIYETASKMSIFKKGWTQNNLKTFSNSTTIVVSNLLLVPHVRKT